MNTLDVPTARGGDRAHAVAKAAAGSIPIVGAAVTELFAWMVKAPLERRRDEWMASVGQKLQELEARGVSLEQLQQTPGFVDTMMQATQAAMSTSSQEKLEALRNAVVNSALPCAPDESTRQMFIRMIDQFTPWHLRMLDLFTDRTTCTPVLTIEARYPGIVKEHREMLQQILADLHTAGLTSFANLRDQPELREQNDYDNAVTVWGFDFLRLIREPFLPSSAQHAAP